VHDVQLEAMPSDHLRAGLRVSAVSIVWTVLSSTTAIVLGIGAGSLVLVVFGAAGLLDAAGSVSLMVHFRHALRHEEFSQRHERLALRLVTGGLLAVGGLTAVESGRRLVEGTHPQAAAGGVMVAGASGLVLGSLSRRKRHIAGNIPSRALLADGWLSATGALLAAVTVAGTGLSATLGWWWADPIAAGAVALGAVAIAAVMARAGVDAGLADRC
jgi:divalent metal cation (Fe/Co/Zn/Cd) transporter